MIPAFISDNYRKILPIIIVCFVIFAGYKHYVKKDTKEIDTISDVFTKKYEQEATVFPCGHEPITYKFTGKAADNGDKPYYTINVIQDGKKIEIQLPVSRTIIKKLKEVK